MQRTQNQDLVEKVPVGVGAGCFSEREMTAQWNLKNSLLFWYNGREILKIKKRMQCPFVVFFLYDITYFFRCDERALKEENHQGNSMVIFTESNTWSPKTLPEKSLVWDCSSSKLKDKLIINRKPHRKLIKLKSKFSLTLARQA